MGLVLFTAATMCGIALLSWLSASISTGGSISFIKEGSVGMLISLCFSIINFWYNLMCFRFQHLHEVVCSVLCAHGAM